MSRSALSILANAKDLDLEAALRLLRAEKIPLFGTELEVLVRNDPHAVWGTGTDASSSRLRRLVAELSNEQRVLLDAVLEKLR